MSYELVNFCEFDTSAIKSYCAIHGIPESRNLGDITKVNENDLEPFSMICGGSPCQDFSVAGKLKGAKWRCKSCEEEYNPLYVHYTKRGCCPKCGSRNIDKTRSSLLVEWLRIIEANKPNWGIYENVKNIVGKQFKETTFRLFEEELKEYGYNTYWKVLNAKDFGIPQNRERVYLILIKQELDNGRFQFPTGFDNGVRLEDLLEDTVDPSFYISQEKVGRFITDKNTFDAVLYDSCQVKRELKSREYNDYSPTLSARDYKDPRIINDSRKDDVVDTLNLRIRKLTPKECFRLMGFSDDDFIKAQSVNSNSQLYKQAGNSIVVDVLYYIFSELYRVMPHLFDDLRVGSYFSGIGAFEKALDRLFDDVGAGVSENFNFPTNVKGGGQAYISRRDWR